jgi:uncharacterized membrane protein
MADQIIVATFNNSNAAYDAATALKALKDRGITDFKPRAGVMVKKDDRGNLSVLESKERPLWGTGVGTVAGALIGLIGGAPLVEDTYIVRRHSSSAIRLFAGPSW